MAGVFVTPSFKALTTNLKDGLGRGSSDSDRVHQASLNKAKSISGDFLYIIESFRFPNT